MPCARDDIVAQCAHEKSEFCARNNSPPPKKTPTSPITPACPNTTVPVDQCILG